jgi:hypothetical protein
MQPRHATASWADSELSWHAQQLPGTEALVESIGKRATWLGSLVYCALDSGDCFLEARTADFQKAVESLGLLLGCRPEPWDRALRIPAYRLERCELVARQLGIWDEDPHQLAGLVVDALHHQMKELGFLLTAASLPEEGDPLQLVLFPTLDMMKVLICAGLNWERRMRVRTISQEFPFQVLAATEDFVAGRLDKLPGVLQANRVLDRLEEICPEVRSLEPRHERLRELLHSGEFLLIWS